MNAPPLPVRYEAMCHAIAEVHGADEAKDIRDKAFAMQVYARQALNLEAEHQCAEIRLRAERRAGELLRETAQSGERVTRQNAKATRGNHIGASDMIERKTLAEMNISPDQSSQFQKLAAVPQDEFDAALRAPDIPSTQGIIARHEATKQPLQAQVSREALWLWGRLGDFESDGFLDSDLAALLGEMQPHMRAACLRVIPRLIDWLKGERND